MYRASTVIVVLGVVAAGSGCGSGSESTDDPDATPSSTPTVDAQPPVVVGPTVPTGFPCGVHAVLQANCSSCHAGHLYYGPNFDSREDFFHPAADLFLVASHPVAFGTFGEHVAVALGDETMPPYGAPARPSSAESELVIAWIGAGMPAGDCGRLFSAP